VEPSEVVLAAIADLAAELPECRVVGRCTDPAQAAEVAARQLPHLVLLRASLASVAGIRRLRACAPGCAVYLTAFRCSGARAAEARLLGADGCLEIEGLERELGQLMAGGLGCPA
jgi:DNA-binding NarL/FixJ family response regulator